MRRRPQGSGPQGSGPGGKRPQGSGPHLQLLPASTLFTTKSISQPAAAAAALWPAHLQRLLRGPPE